jgi:hypothetical protein
MSNFIWGQDAALEPPEDYFDGTSNVFSIAENIMPSV